MTDKVSSECKDSNECTLIEYVEAHTACKDTFF